MTHVRRRPTTLRGQLARSIAPMALLLLPMSLLSSPSVATTVEGAAPSSAVASSATGTLFAETFESGKKGWSTSRRTKLRTVPRGHRSAKAARLTSRGAGTVLAKRVVRPGSTTGSRHVVSAWVRSPRGPQAARLVVREVLSATGKVVSTKRDRLRAGKKWKKAKVVLTGSSRNSVLVVSVRAEQKRRGATLVDNVRVRRTKVGRSGGSDPAPKPSNGDFPNASNTGVPAGVSLSSYSGPTTITKAGTVIDAKQINGGLTIRAKNVTIKRSKVKGTVYVEQSGSLTMTDSIVDGGKSANSAISQFNMTLKRVEVVGARASVGCAANCDVQDSWLHGQYMKPGSDWHGDGFLTNGGDNMTLRHNTLACDSKPTGAGGACSAALAAYGDFSPVTNMTVDNNLFVESPAGYCMYAGYDPQKPHGKGAKNVVVTNNVFERGANGKCAAFGPVAAVAPSGSKGNVFSGNVWSDGDAVRR